MTSGFMASDSNLQRMVKCRLPPVTISKGPPIFLSGLAKSSQHNQLLFALINKVYMYFT